MSKVVIQFADGGRAVKIALDRLLDTSLDRNTITRMLSNRTVQSSVLRYRYCGGAEYGPIFAGSNIKFLCNTVLWEIQLASASTLATLQAHTG